MTLNSHPPKPARSGRTRQWRAIELANKSQFRETGGVGSLVALVTLAALVLTVLFALPG